MGFKQVCVSFDFEHDRNYYYLIEAWNSNPNIPFWITNCTPKEIQTDSVSIIKQVLSKKIGEAQCMIALIGDHSDDWHPDHNDIGYKNWQAYEIEKNKEKGNKLVVVKLNRSCVPPIEAYDCDAKWINTFNLDDIKNAIEQI